MNAATSAEKERTEVDQLLQSGVFEKSPRLERFFRYICDRHFDGRVDGLKEYSIALEALGRQPDFDPKKDSIVRVEAHRLRKRLDEFYRGPGSSHDLYIVIPNGQYRPHFIPKSNVDKETPETLSINHDTLAVAEPPQLAVVDPREIAGVFEPPETPVRHSRLLVCFVVALGCVTLLALLIRTTKGRSDGRTAKPAEEFWIGKPVDTAGAEIRILAGYHGPPYIDRQSHMWQSDAFYQGGTSRPIAADHYIEAQPDPHLLRSARVGKFRYAIPLRQGTYELHLLFAETEFGNGNKEGTGEGSRTFEVKINGEVAIPSCDPLAEAAAPNRLDERVLRDISPASDGKLHIDFEGTSGTPAVLSGIELVPSAPGLLHPIRMVAQANPVTDSDGRVWAADEFVIGGTSVFRENTLFDPKEKALYRGERFGNFSYRIPLAPGKYRVTLHFAEQWFGTPSSHIADVDRRVFDVYANGVALLRDFIVARAAGGPNRSVIRSFDNLQPNAQGTLVLEFLPVKNYAELNAIEVVQTR